VTEDPENVSTPKPPRPGLKDDSAEIIGRLEGIDEIRREVEAVGKQLDALALQLNLST